MQGKLVTYIAHVARRACSPMAERRLKLCINKLPCEDGLSSRYAALRHPRHSLEHKMFTYYISR